MASDLSSACTDDIQIFDEKEEGEISLEDVSSSEESHPHYRLASRNGGCPSCMSLQQCSPWCSSARILRRRLHRRQDGDHGKENRRKVKESSGTIGKQQVTSTLQEKNDEDLVPISSDSDMEVVGLPGNSKHVACRTSPKSSKVRKKKKKKRNQHGDIETGRIDEPVASVGAYELVKDSMGKAAVHSSRSYHRDASSPRYSLGTTAPVEKASLRSPSRRYRAAGRNVKSRSPLRRSRSPVLNHANPMARRLSRKLRSSRRSLSRSPVRFDAEARESRDSAASPAHVDLYASKLLKKVRRLESVGTFSSRNKRSRSKEHSSLKEKLNNMMRNKETTVRGATSKTGTRLSGRIVENNNVDRSSQHAGGKSKDDEDDDIELLRRLALETKQKKTESKNEEGTRSSNEHSARIEANLSDDNDSEALELRMIALHSAVMNKHRNRVERGLGSKKNRSGNNPRNESPLSLSFLDVTPVPDELSDNSVQSSVPKSLAHDDEPNHPEDMDLDRDIEREKDSRPYSPTDDLTTRQINVDEQPPIVESQQAANIETSENLSTATSLAVGNDLAIPRTEADPQGSIAKSSLPESAGTDTAKLTRMLHSPERSGYTSSESLTNYIENPDAPYSPSKPLEASKIDEPVSPVSKSMLNFESPYSPTDAPINDPELIDISFDVTVGVSTNCQNSQTSKNGQENSTPIGDSNLVPMMLKMSMNEAAIPADNQPERSPIPNEQVAIVSSSFFPQDDESLKFYDAIIDQLPDIDLDGSPLVPVTEASHSDIPATSGLTSLSNEPLYLQGLPDVTRDNNKIPTLVNKSLVPAAILKTNKQLQQPLPLKKVENPIEPSFKSAEMRPVSELEIAGRNTTKTFKPIKFCPLMKKPQVMMASAAAFNSSFGDDVTATVSKNEENTNIPTLESATEKTENPIEPISSAALPTKPNSHDPEKPTKSSEKHGIQKSANNNEKSNSQDRRKSNGSEKVKAQSVDKYVSHSALERSEETEHRTPKRAASSPAVNDRASSRRRANNQTFSFDSPVVLAKTPARRNPMDSSSEANASKPLRKKKTRRGGVKRRNRLDKSRSNGGGLSILENLRSNQEAEKITRSSKEPDESMSSSIEMKEPKDVAMKETLVAEEPSNEMPKNPVTESPEESTKSAETEKSRRLSLDEDEEALRALLLASLPKRIKTAEVTPEATNPTVKTTRTPEATSAEIGLENSSVNSKKVVGNDETSTPLLAPGASLASSLSSNSASCQSLGKFDSLTNIQVPRTIVAGETNSSLSSSSTSAPLTPRKRSSSVVLKNPPKKIAKKALPALASTRVVNNAKKYQNAMLQKRLNLQRASTSYNATTGSRNITLNNLKTYENARPTSPKMTNASSKTQRLVINLESDTDSDDEPSKQKPNSNVKPSDTSTAQQQKPLAIPTTDFEKSLEQFLKDQRKKTESNVATNTTTPSSATTNLTKSLAPSNSAVKDLGIYNTPLAVRRHLPVSQQEEYRRLKQQIIERERQMLQKNIDYGVSSANVNTRSPCTPPGPLSPASPIAAAILVKSQAQRISPHVVGPSAGSSGEKIEEKTGGNGALSSAGKVAKPQVDILRRSSLSSGAGTWTEIARPENVSQNPATTSTPKALNVNSQLSRRSVGKTAALQSKKNNSSATKENAENLSVSKAPTFRDKINSLTNLARTSLTSGSTNGSNNFIGSLKGTEMLTIQIPNDKIQTDRSMSSSLPAQSIANLAENSEPPGAPRTSPALRVLSTEQLNNRFVKIQVERTAAGRKVTVAPTVSDHLPSSVNSPASSTLCASSDAKKAQTVFCDNSSSLDSKDAPTRNEDPSSKTNVEKDYDENSLHRSDASTLILSENERITGDESTASTLILSRDGLRTHENLDSTRCNDTPSPNTAITKQTKRQFKEVCENLRMDVKNELKMLEKLSANEQNQFLLETQENLIAKRNMVLEDLTEMSGYLRQWEFEREIQTKLVAEVRRLREQLRAAESRLDEQRRQMNDMGPRVTKTHEKINQGRRECYKLSRICQGLGNRVVGPNYKIPNTNARLLNEQLREVAAHTRQLSKKKVPALNNALNSSGDVTFSSAMADVSVGSVSSIGPLSETVNRIDTPNTSMSGTDNEEDANEAHELERENEVPIAESNDPVLPEGEKESSMDSFSECPHCELKPKIVENEEMRLREVENEGNDKEASGSKEIDESVHEVLNLSESNAPSTETENPVEPEANFSSNETEIRLAPQTNYLPNESEASNAPDTDIPSNESGSHQLTETNKNAWSLEALENTEPETTASSTKKTEIHLVTLAQNVPAPRHQTEHQLSLPGTSRSVSPAFSLPNDSPKTSKRRHTSYNSVLTHFRTTRNVNPNGILCPYELMGTCNDGDCQYYHLDPARQCQ